MTAAQRRNRSFLVGFIGAGIALAGAFILVMMPTVWVPPVSAWPDYQVRSLRGVNVGLCLILISAAIDGWPVTDPGAPNGRWVDE